MALKELFSGHFSRECFRRRVSSEECGMTTDLGHTNVTKHAQALFRQLFLAAPDAIVVTAIERAYLCG